MKVLRAIRGGGGAAADRVVQQDGLQTVDHADAAVDALQSVPGRFVLAYGNLPWSNSAGGSRQEG